MDSVNDRIIKSCSVNGAVASCKCCKCYAVKSKRTENFASIDDKNGSLMPSSKLPCLVLSVSAVWTKLETNRDCRRQKISKLNMFSFFGVLSCLEMRCELSFVVSRPTFQFADGTKLFNLKYIEDYWKLSWLVPNLVHTADTDKTRQNCRLLSGVNYARVIICYGNINRLSITFSGLNCIPTACWGHFSLRFRLLLG